MMHSMLWLIAKGGPLLVLDTQTRRRQKRRWGDEALGRQKEEQAE